MLLDRVRKVAHRLTEAGLAGDRVLLAYPTMLDFAVALLGCFQAGVVAVPVYLPSPHRSNKPLHAIARNCSAAAVLTTAHRRAGLIEHFAELPALRIMATDDVDQEPAPADWMRPAITADHLAFLQYTSGTTGSPRGVMVSHGNLIANLEMIKTQFGARRTVSCGSWLPLFHDMGLIGTLLQPLYAGMHALHMSPIEFLKRPVRWLQMISSFRVGFSGGPSFAYEYCVARIPDEQKAGLDLGCWELAFNGAEPVRADTIERFADAFAGCGFRREAFYPCYGMAEATLFATGPRHGALRPIVERFDAAALDRGEAVAATNQDRTTRTLVSCGKPDPALTLEIVDPERCVRCAAGSVGEIWLAGPSVTRSYWGQSEANAAFDAHLLDEQGRRIAGPFYRTGDLGLMHGAELYVTGRRKDLVIINGRNHYPQDIEMTVDRCHPAVQRGGVAAFAIELDACEVLGLAIEIDRPATHDPAAMQEILRTVRCAIATEHEIAVGLAVLVRAGSLPRTTSGKLRRKACLDAIATGALPSYASLGSLPAVASLAGTPQDASGETL
jgi:acyl-CoA synthetase (AMP-forming)/AMP-acid ligase II